MEWIYKLNVIRSIKIALNTVIFPSLNVKPLQKVLRVHFKGL